MAKTRKVSNRTRRASPAGAAASNSATKTGDAADTVARAYRKIMDGSQSDLSAEEKSALKRHEKEKEERLRWQFYNAIPQKHWRQMSGRQTKVINEQAERHGIPFGGATINLSAVVRALHDFLADNKHRLSREDDPLLSGVSSPALERFREERASLARLDRLEREEQLIPRDLTRQALGKMAAIPRTAGETLQVRYGLGASEILCEALDDVEAELDRFLSSSQSEVEADAALDE